MSQDIQTRLPELKLLAEAATPGAWLADNDCVRPEGDERNVIAHVCTQAYSGVWREGEAIPDSIGNACDAEFIAAANPATLLALVAHIEELEQQLADLRQAERQAPEGFAIVPLEPTEDQWGGLARDIVMAWDMDCKTPSKLFRHLERCGRDIPDWLRNEAEMRNLDHVPSKGTRAVIIYRAMIADAPSAGQAKPDAS